jgi:hypothetical protein
VTFVVVSQPLSTGVTGEAWLASREASNAARFPTDAQCWPAPANMERTNVDGLPAWLHSGCSANEAIAFAGGRVYLITGFPDPTYNRPRFDAFLSTVTFDPTKADDSPVANPSPSASCPPSQMSPSRRPVADKDNAGCRSRRDLALRDCARRLVMFRTLRHP